MLSIETNFQVWNICRENNVAFAISGSGSTMLLISDNLDILDKIKSNDYDVKVLDVGQGVKILGWVYEWRLLCNS